MRSSSTLTLLLVLAALTAFTVDDAPADDDGDVIVLVLTSATRGKLAGCG